MTTPAFRYHPDPVRSGSVITAEGTCRCCGKSRGLLYAGPVYSESAGDELICPWCIADGSAHRKLRAEFVDSEALTGDVPEAVMAEVVTRTPGISMWQGEVWPVCCNDASGFIMPAGIAELRALDRQLEFVALNHVIYDLGISGGAATRLVQSLNRDQGPTAYLFRCLHCDQYLIHIDQP